MEIKKEVNERELRTEVSSKFSMEKLEFKRKPNAFSSLIIQGVKTTEEIKRVNINQLLKCFMVAFEFKWLIKVLMLRMLGFSSCVFASQDIRKSFFVKAVALCQY